MKTFIIKINFLKPFDSFGEIVARHREYLQQGYDQQMILMSGPREDKKGGICVARALSAKAVQDFFDLDPYKLAGLAEHEIIAFSAVKHQDFISSWLT